MAAGKAQILSGRTAIIAGNGYLPLEVAKTLEKRGESPFLIPIKGEADPALYRYDHCEISIVQLARLIDAMKKAKISNVILAGGVQSRPYLRDLRFDWTTLSALPRLFSALGKGDDALLRAFIAIVESHGFKVVGAHEVVPELLAPAHAALTKKRADKKELKNISIAAEAAYLLGALDIGQGAVAVGGRIVAVEGAEGTDNMLKRISEMRVERRIPKEGGVLLKRAKPQQDARADLPTIGPSTIENAYQCGLCGVAIEAGRSFIMELEKTIQLADHYDMFIETFENEVSL